MSRIAMCDILVGVNGAGKTTFLRENIVNSLKEKGHRILIVTNADNQDWKDVEFLKDFKEIETFTGIRKMIYKKGRLEKIQQYYNKGTLILDDCRLYIQLQTTDFMNWLQVLRRHVGIDLFCVFHGLTQVPPIFFTFSSNLVLFHTLDNIKRRGYYIEEYLFEEIQEKKQRILSEVNKGNKYHFEIIKLDKRL